MDNNDKISKIPVSELTPENIKSLKKESGGDEPVRMEKSTNHNGSNRRLMLVILGIILLAGVGVALYFILRQPATDSSQTTEEDKPAEIVWQPSEDSEDPGQEYIDKHQSTINDPGATTDDKLDAQLSIANFYSATERYQEAEDLLNSISRDALTSRQLFNLYSAYAYLYDDEHSNNEAAYKEYSALIEEVLATDWGEDDKAPSEGTGE